MSPPSDPPATPESVFAANKRRLVGLAYRLTGSVAEAEDIVQETSIKWLAADQSAIDSPAAWLSKVTTNLSLDYLKSARVQREEYIGPWLPEPWLPSSDAPDHELELDESLSMALLLVLEQLTPAERASFVLHDIFAYSFAEVAVLLERSEAGCRQLASRARSKVKQARNNNPQNKQQHELLIARFIEAMKAGDMDALQSLLAVDVSFHSDGGGKAIAARKVLAGLDKVVRFILRAIKPSLDQLEAGQGEISRVWFNGTPGYVTWNRGEPVAAYNFVISNDRIVTIHALRNPDKLRFFKRQSQH